MKGDCVFLGINVYVMCWSFIELPHCSISDACLLHLRVLSDVFMCLLVCLHEWTRLCCTCITICDGSDTTEHWKNILTYTEIPWPTQKYKSTYASHLTYKWVHNNKNVTEVNLLPASCMVTYWSRQTSQCLINWIVSIAKPNASFRILLKVGYFQLKVGQFSIKWCLWQEEGTWITITPVDSKWQTINHMIDL